MGAVLLDVGFGGANDDVEVHADVGVAEPRGVVGRETDGVVACFVGCESESAVQRSDCLYDNVSRGFFLGTGSDG